MEKASDIINELLSRKEFRRKRDVADFFGVSPQALSIWIAKGVIPPKHLLKLSKENLVNEKSENSQFQSEYMSSESESKTVIDYLMRENVKLKQEIESLKNSQSYTYCDSTLKVSLPVISNWNKETYSFAYTGQLPSEFTLDEMNAVLKYVRSQIQDMTGNTHIIIKDDRQKF